MRGAVYLGKENVEIRELPTPVCGPRDVLIQNIYSSICGTDVAVYLHGPGTGHRVDVGGEFGHETISRVVEVGSEVKDFHVGDRVYPYPRLARRDPRRAGTLGGFSEYILCPEPVWNESLYAVPDSIPDRLACLIEPFTVGCRAARRGQPQPGDKAVVFGSGTIGIAAAIALKYFGLQQVMVCDYSDFRLDIASGLGFDVCNPAKGDFITKASATFGTGQGLAGEVADINLWIDAAGADSILDQFIQLGRIHSRFVSVAVNSEPRNIDLLRMTYAQLSLIGSGGYFPEDVTDVLKIMESGKWDLQSIITGEYPLGQLAQAIQTAADVNRALNIVIHMDEEEPS